MGMVEGLEGHGSACHLKPAAAGPLEQLDISSVPAPNLVGLQGDEMGTKV